MDSRFEVVAVTKGSAGKTTCTVDLEPAFRSVPGAGALLVLDFDPAAGRSGAGDQESAVRRARIRAMHQMYAARRRRRRR